MSRLTSFCIISILWTYSLVGLNAQALDTAGAESSLPDDISSLYEVDTAFRLYDMRVGIDVLPFVLPFFGSTLRGWQAHLDARLYTDYYIDIIAGYNSFTFEGFRAKYTASGYFVRIGVNKNILHTAFIGEKNDMMYYALRYGLASVGQEIPSYIVKGSEYWQQDEGVERSRSQSPVFSHWIEVGLGVRTEIHKRIFLTVGMNLNLLLAGGENQGIENVYVPGFGDQKNALTFGFHYTVSYWLPFIYKEERRPIQ